MKLAERLAGPRPPPRQLLVRGVEVLAVPVRPATLSGGSVGGRAPASITKTKTAAARSEPTIGPTRYGQTPPQKLATRAGPNHRAGLKEPPVSGPPTMTMKPRVVPIASGAQSCALFTE